MNIDIKDKVIVSPPEISKQIFMIVTNVILFESVMVRVLFFKLAEEGRTQIDEKTVVMSGQDYLNWGTDDTYLENYVFAQLGIEKK